jgi:hypothetical protein
MSCTAAAGSGRTQVVLPSRRRRSAPRWRCGPRRCGPAAASRCVAGTRRLGRGQVKSTLHPWPRLARDLTSHNATTALAPRTGKTTKRIRTPRLLSDTSSAPDVLVTLAERSVSAFSRPVLRPGSPTTVTGAPASPSRRWSRTPSGIRRSCHRPRGTCHTPREQETKLPTLEVVMSELDDFLATTLARQVEAEEVLHNGDPDRGWRCGQPRTR